MKKNNIKKIILVVALLFTIAINSKKSYAVDPFTPLIFGQDVAKKIYDVGSDIKDFALFAQTAYSTYQSAGAVVKNLKNFDLSTFAQNIGSDKILDYGNVALKVITGNQGNGINIATKGNQVITNLLNYKDKVSTNAIKNAVNDLKEPDNSSMYGAEIKNQIAK